MPISEALHIIFNFSGQPNSEVHGFLGQVSYVDKFDKRLVAKTYNKV